MKVLDRWQAAARHLAITVVVAGIVSIAIWQAWYPDWLLRVAGGVRLIGLLWLAVLVAGPLLTLLVYRHGKKGMAFDLVVIALLQVAALAATTWMLAHARPVFVVLAVDRFAVVPASELLPGDFDGATPPYDRALWDGPRFVAALPPTDKEGSEQVMASALTGRDVEYFPRYYADYARHAPAAIARAQPLVTLRGRDADTDARIDAFLRDHPEIAEPGYLALVARHGDYVAIIAGRDPTVRAVLPISPW